MDTDARQTLRKFLFIPEKYTKVTKNDDRFIALVHRTWLSSLLQKGRPDIFKYHEKLTDFEVDLFLKLGEPFDSSWQFLSIRVIRFDPEEKVYPLPRPRQTNATLDSLHLSYSQLLHYINHSNYKNSWKDSFRKFSSLPGTKDLQRVPLLSKNAVLLEVVKRVYSCPVINLDTQEVFPAPKDCFQTHPNCLPTLCAVFNSQHLFLLQNHIPHSLFDCVTFSPAVLNSARSRSLFIIFQLLRLLRDTYDKGVVLGGVNLHDLLISTSLWVSVVPKIEENLIAPAEIDSEHPYINCKEVHSILLRNEKSREKALNQLLDLWVRGQLSNFDYLIALNCLAGRKFGHPSHHHVLPWVTDFSTSNDGWRDLSKSKFRLNKGDRQLDLTFETASNHQSCDSHLLQIPHHVSDFLSEITYFVYLARRTPKSLLCKYVRPNWVPAEYPSSIQRLQEWTPDECIPEFYTDANTFKSIHEDLPDLELPSWASSPEHFVEKHRQALESVHVSERLHHWIDLTFGYKLSGSAAIKSKNVCLYLVDNHTNLSDCGAVQLFTQPHPHKITPNPYMEISAPKIAIPTCKKRLENTLPCILSPVLSTPDNIEDMVEFQSETPEDSSPLGVFKPLSKSKSFLAAEEAAKAIHLPKDFNPISLLQDVENLFHFSSEVLHENAKDEISEQQDLSSPYKKAVAASRVKEMQTLGCLIVEIYLATKLRAADLIHCDFNQRLDRCLKVVEKEWRDMPCAVKKITSLLLEVDDFGKKSQKPNQDFYHCISSGGLPPPSAHQLLQPLLSSVVPFPEYFESLYILLAGIYELESSPDDTSELQVNLFHKELPQLLQKMDQDGINLLIPHIVRLLKSESATNAAWRLFDPVAKALGPQKSAKELLDPICDLLESGGATRAKLYHRSFLLKLMVRFGLKIFIVNFVKPLVEAVGGYKDQQCKTPTLDSERRKSDALGAVENFAMYEGEAGILSPLDEDSSADSEKLVTEQEVFQTKKEEVSDTENELVFVLENNNENEESDPVNLVTSPAVALDLMAQLEIDMDQEPENTNANVEIDEAKDSTPEELAAATPVQTEWRPPRRPTAATEFPVSEESAESLLWLAHRLGPVLTARHLSRNLLRMLSLCYLGESSLAPSKGQDSCCQAIPGLKLVGDDNSARVLSCLAEIAAIYGEQLVVVQYFGHMSELIALCKRKLTQNLEAGLIGCLSLVCSIIPYLSDSILMEQLTDILKNILHPSVRLVATTRAPFPCGATARLALAYKLLEALYMIALRIGTDMTRMHLSVTLQRYFLAFDKAYDQTEPESSHLEVKRESTDITLRGSPLQISHVMVYESIDSFSPPAPILEAANEIRSKALHEIKAVFNEKLAHCIYIPFYRLLGESLMEKIMKNEPLVRDLCYQYEQMTPRLKHSQGTGSLVYLSDLLPTEENLAGTSGSFGTNVSVIGNRIELQRPDIPSTLPSPGFKNLDEVSNIISKRMENTSRHLRGNWLAYWDHEIGRADKDNKFNFKQIKLQQFTGHTHSVRALHVLDNENSFISGSRDKTVKLWSLRSQGDGTTASTCRWSYNQHRKSVLAIAYVEPMGLVASCDSIVHLWDPFMGATVAVLDGANRTANSPVNVLHSMPAPSCSVLAATTDATLKIVDIRTAEYVIEMKVANSAGGLIRCISVCNSGNTVAVGQSSGHLALLDVRMGMILSSWKGHEGEVLQLASSGSNLVSSSLDQTVATWSSDNGNLRCILKGPTEPVHCLNAYNSELISGTTANRIGVHTSVGEQACFSSTRLRSDTFKGVLTAMAVLPLNRLLLLGSDAGHISLLC
ncbi:WD repeat-containing protein 81 isoform X2 [Neocloeon triangulifer]|uniref:WD repeat-containing protein 81 isoform X2 n=1 Tax=Neocloeon triangulifer TaxID=2078957 RepID=UPI00286F1CF8|nr:WD repeat-containing protein 81 isoform X2 [Neocloeon triangulifer]